MLLVRRTRPAVRSVRTPFARRRSSSKAVPRATVAAASAGGIALGAILEYLLDPSAGRRRRHTARDRTLSRVRRGERRAVRRARRAESHAVGVARRTINPRRFRHREPLDDVTLAHKVETQLSRRAGVPTNEIVVNAEEGVVFLRGVVERREDMERLESAARDIAGVRGVENLLHPPGTPAPASRPKLERQRNGG